MMDSIWANIFAERNVSPEDWKTWSYLKEQRPSSLLKCSPRFFSSLESQIEVCGALTEEEKNVLGDVVDGRPACPNRRGSPISFFPRERKPFDCARLLTAAAKSLAANFQNWLQQSH